MIKTTPQKGSDVRTLNDNEKQSVIRDCVEKVIIKDDQIEIFYRFMVKPSEQIA